MLSHFYVLLLEHTNSARQKMTELVWRTPLLTAGYRYEHYTKNLPTQNRVNDAQVEGLDGFWGYIYKSDSGHALKLWHNIFAGSSKTAQTGKSRQLRFHEFVHQHGLCNEMMKT